MWTALSIVLSLVVVALGLLAPGWILQASCSATGTPIPRFVQALGIAFAAMFASFVVQAGTGCTVGVLIGSGWIASIVQLVIGFGVVSVVYSALLRIPLDRAGMVAFVSWVISAIIGGGAFAVIRAIVWWRWGY
jgi:hypothetical protein